MTEPPEEFAALLDRARHGDREALGRLARRYEPDVRLVAQVRLGRALRPYLDTVDLVQSVHRSLLLGLREDRFDVSTPEKLVALALARRKVARHWRRLRRQARLSGGAAGADGLPQLLLSLGDAQDDPAQQAERKEAVESLCAGLGGAERRLLELRLQGYTTAEAAR